MFNSSCLWYYTLLTLVLPMFLRRYFISETSSWDILKVICDINSYSLPRVEIWFLITVMNIGSVEAFILLCFLIFSTNSFICVFSSVKTFSMSTKSYSGKWRPFNKTKLKFEKRKINNRHCDMPFSSRWKIQISVQHALDLLLIFP